MSKPLQEHLPANFKMNDRLVVRLKTRQFEETKNPIYAIEVFIIAQKAKLSIPVSVMKWLRNCLGAWHEEQGRTSMDEAMGLTTGSGKTPLFKDLYLETRNDKLCVEMLRLCTLGFSMREAARAMEYVQVENEWNKTLWDMAEITADTLYDKFKRWKKTENAQFLAKEFKGKISWEILRGLPKCLIPKKVYEGFKPHLLNPPTFFAQEAEYSHDHQPLGRYKRGRKKENTPPSRSHRKGRSLP